MGRPEVAHAMAHKKRVVTMLSHLDVGDFVSGNRSPPAKLRRG